MKMVIHIITFLLPLSSFAGAVNYSDYRCESWRTAKGPSWRILESSENKDVPTSHMTSLGFASQEDCENSLAAAKLAKSDLVCAPTMSALGGTARTYSLFDLYSGKNVASQKLMTKTSCDELAKHSTQTFFCSSSSGESYELIDSLHKEKSRSFSSRSDCFSAIDKIQQEMTSSPVAPAQPTTAVPD